MPSKRVVRRQKTNRWAVIAVVAIVVVVVALVIVNSTVNSTSAKVAGAPPPAPLDKCGQAACGDAKAPVTLDVYADFQCPYCAQFDPVLQQLVPNYIDTGKVKLVYHNFPVIGAESDTAAQAADCAADQNKFWRFANSMFVHQGAENSGVFTVDNLKKMAGDVGMDTNTFGACVTSGKYSGAVQQSLADGRQKGVAATPTFFINGQKNEGGVGYTQLVALLNKALGQ